jgi:hypothetical protein
VELGFTGTREALTEAQGASLCKALWYYKQWATIMHNGDCVGADEYAGKYWQLCGGQLWLHPPTVRQHRANLPGELISKALPHKQRNMAIVLASDIIIACPKEAAEVARSGTWATIRYAREAGKRLFIIYPNGTVEGD